MCDKAQLGFATNADLIRELSCRYDNGSTHPEYATMNEEDFVYAEKKFVDVPLKIDDTVKANVVGLIETDELATYLVLMSDGTVRWKDMED